MRQIPSSEFTFITICLKVFKNKTDYLLLHSLLKKSDENELINTALKHGVLPLVYKTLKEKSLITSNINNSLLLRLKKHYHSIAKQNISMSAELIQINSLLTKHQIRIIAFKGPALAQLAYGDITLRQFSDIDLLISQKDVISTYKLLEKTYKTTLPLKSLQYGICLNVNNDIAFRDAKKNIWIELHWKLFREKITQNIEFEYIIQNTQTIKINNRSILTFSNELYIVYLCLHGSKHAWERLEWICDIDRLIHASNTTLDWSMIDQLATKLDSKTTLYLGLSLSHLLFDTPLPKHIEKEIANPSVITLTDKTLKLLHHDFFNLKGYARYNLIHQYQRELLETQYAKLKHILHTYFSISRNDCEFLPLPKPLIFLYFVIKPFRVAWKYITSNE